MRMILMLGIMFVSLPAAPSLFTSADADTDASRSNLLRAILLHTNKNKFHDKSKRAEAIVNVPIRLDCCPSKTRLIHPRGGESREGKALEIYRDHRTLQKFYQRSCLEEVENRPCLLIDAKNQRSSRCVQKYSYVYAFVKDLNVSENFRLDYIKLKSGCSCEMEVFYPEVLNIN